MIAPRVAALCTLLFASTCTAAFASDRPRLSNFAGVNFPELPFLEESARNEAIREVVAGGANVIRFTIKGTKDYPDPEVPLGTFNNHMLDMYDDTLAAIHRISKGKTKVIIAPHEMEALRAPKDATDTPCDSYCDEAEGFYLDFYTKEPFREAYKKRLAHFFTKYKSKNFGKASWNTLKDVILGVDVENKPFSGIHPLPFAHYWFCEIATHMKDTLELGKNGIAVISGGVSGLNSESGWQNWPAPLYECDAIDIIGIHGSFSATDESTAGTSWMKMLLPGNTMLAKSLDKKLVIVEDVHNDVKGEDKQQAAVDIWDQGNALNHRGIPWLGSYVSKGTGDTKGRIDIDGKEGSAKEALWDVMKRAKNSVTVFDWSQYLPQSELKSTRKEVAQNPYRPFAGETFGGLGWICNAVDDCEVGSVCKNNICQRCENGCPGMRCDALTKCQEWSECVGGVCQECDSWNNASCFYGVQIAGQKGMAAPLCESKICNFCDKQTQSCRGSPCARTSDCSWDETCEWGACKPCTTGCLGSTCANSMDCKTGICNNYKKCDYPPPNTQPLPPPAVRPSRKEKKNQGNVGPHPVILGNPRDVTQKVDQPMATAT